MSENLIKPVTFGELMAMDDDEPPELAHNGVRFDLILGHVHAMIALGEVDIEAMVAEMSSELRRVAEKHLGPLTDKPHVQTYPKATGNPLHCESICYDLS